jgi:hypothetical protein
VDATQINVAANEMARPLSYAKWDHLPEYDAPDDDDDDGGGGSSGKKGAARAAPRRDREPLIALTVPWDTFSGAHPHPRSRTLGHGVLTDARVAQKSCGGRWSGMAGGTLSTRTRSVSTTSVSCS